VSSIKTDTPAADTSRKRTARRSKGDCYSLEGATKKEGVERARRPRSSYAGGCGSVGGENCVGLPDDRAGGEGKRHLRPNALSKEE